MLTTTSLKPTTYYQLLTMNTQSIINKLASCLADYCMEANIHSTITGVSGGLDSAVTIYLAQKASEIAREKGFELRSIGLILPCHSDPAHAVLGKKVIKGCGAELLEIDLTGIFDLINKDILKPIANDVSEYHKDSDGMRFRTSQGNVKARLRMGLGTYYVANMVNGLVLSTDNYSEYWMGFWTLHGDVGDYGVIQEIWKGSELIEIAQELGVPQEVIDAAPTDGLNVLEGGDEAQLGAPYPIVDNILRSLMMNGIDLDGSLNQLDSLPEIDGVESALVRKIAERSLKNAFKRQSTKKLSRGELEL
jgi:NAD+ synthase